MRPLNFHFMLRKRIGVIDLGFGDCGKGLTTSFLCNKYIKEVGDGVVVRSNGGHQAGHTVVYKGKRHVFSQFGSGTLQNVPTFISKNCTIYPPSLLREYEYIKEYNPMLWVDPMTMITTPWDVITNRELEKSKSNGSVGMGFGQTIDRNEKHFNLYFQDLFFEDVLREKLYNICMYYNGQVSLTYDFINQCKELVESAWCSRMTWRDIDNFNIVIFESAQGVMLDQHFGFFPNVTRSNTTSKNMWEMSNLNEIYYITRTYQTRHGKGYMSDTGKPNLKNFENETNKSHEFQGEFRTAYLDKELLKYALTCDLNFGENRYVKRNLIVTCNDQLEMDENITTELIEFASLENVYYSYGPSLTDIKVKSNSYEQSYI